MLKLGEPYVINSHYRIKFTLMFCRFRTNIKHALMKVVIKWCTILIGFSFYLLNYLKYMQYFRMQNFIFLFDVCLFWNINILVNHTVVLSFFMNVYSICSVHSICSYCPMLHSIEDRKSIKCTMFPQYYTYIRVH